VGLAAAGATAAVVAGILAGRRPELFHRRPLSR
jgi:hypothetical protein